MYPWTSTDHTLYVYTHDTDYVVSWPGSSRMPWISTDHTFACTYTYTAKAMLSHGWLVRKSYVSMNVIHVQS